ncbi:MAG: TSUP family transporter [Thermodesulfobacteriota bacterium]
MEYLVICAVSLVVAGLTLFSGFGLGTILLPAFAIFFPIPIAVAATAVVHLANNLFKVVLVGKHANRGIVVAFGIPAIAFAAIGAALLGYLSGLEPILRYGLGAVRCEVMWVKVVVATLIAGFSLMEILPRFQDLAFDAKYVPLGGVLSGFFGGLSGLQGALRSAFLIRCGLDKEAFIGTGVVLAVVVDLSRLAIYGSTFLLAHVGSLQGSGVMNLTLAGMVAAFVGSAIGVRLLRKTTIRAVQLIVSVMLIALSMALAAGLI